MKIVLRKSTQIQDHIEIVEVDGDPTKVPTTMTYESEESAVSAVAQYLGILTSEINEVRYQK